MRVRNWCLGCIGGPQRVVGDVDGDIRDQLNDHAPFGGAEGATEGEAEVDECDG